MAKYNKGVDVAEIFEAARGKSIVDIISQYRDVKPSGSKYVALCPFHNEKTPSLSINPNAGDSGLFKCFGCGESGDAITFVSKVENVSAVDAAAIITGTKISSIPKREYERTEQKTVHSTTKHINTRTLPTTINHVKFGTPARAFVFYTQNGDIAGIECRFELEDGRKTYQPYTFRENEKGERFWAFKGIDGLRPPYNLPKVISSQKVMLHEGAKCADAGQKKWLPEIAHTAFFNGAKSVHTNDFSFFKGKDVIIFGDNDKPGREFTEEAAKRLVGVANTVRYIEHSSQMPPKFDMDDIGTDKAPTTKDWQKQDVVNYIKHNIKDYSVKVDIEAINEVQVNKADKSNLADLEYILLGAMLREPKEVIINLTAFNRKWLSRSNVGAKSSQLSAALNATVDTIKAGSGGAAHFVVCHVASASYGQDITEQYLAEAMGNAYDVTLETVLQLWRDAYLDNAYYLASRVACDGVGHEDRERRRKAVLSDMQVFTDTSTTSGEAEFVEMMTQAFEGIVIEYPCRTPLQKMQDNGFEFFKPQTLNVVAARPGIGKTTLALQLMKKYQREGRKGAFFTLEMSKRQMLEVLFTLEANVYSGSKFTNFSPSDLQHCKNAMEYVANAGYNIIDNVYTIEEIEAQCIGMAAAGTLDYIVVDYVQLVQSSSMAKSAIREQVVAHVSRTLKRLSKDLNISVFALAQVGRAGEGTMPTLRDLRESGAIEADADVVAFLHYDREESAELRGVNVPALINIAKHRGGATIGIKCFYSFMFGFTDDEVVPFNREQVSVDNTGMVREKDTSDLPF